MCVRLPCFNKTKSDELTQDSQPSRSVVIAAEPEKTRVVHRPSTSPTTSKPSQELPSERELDAAVESKPLPPPTDRSTIALINETGTQEDLIMADQLKGVATSAQDTVSSGAEQVASGTQQAASHAQDATTSAVSGDGQSATQPVTSATSEGTQKWDAMTEEQKKAAFDSLPAEKKQGKTYYEWIKEGYYNQKENWMPWIEDQYLKWFTKDNKASYATKDALGKTKVTGIDQVDALQDGVNDLTARQVGQGGVLQPVGDAVSKEGINRAERGGKDDSSSYAGGVGTSVVNGASNVGNSVWSGAKSAGGYVGGMFGGKKEEGGQQTEETK